MVFHSETARARDQQRWHFLVNVIQVPWSWRLVRFREVTVRKQMVAMALIGAAQGGCGTLHNLNGMTKDEPAWPIQAIGSGPGRCVPFGGVARSAMMGMVMPGVGLGEVINGELSILQGEDAAEGFRRIGNGIWGTGIGLVALADTPVSLVGDLVTWPIAYARQQQQPWATWWGKERGTCWLNGFGPNPPATDEKKPSEEESSKGNR